MGDGESQLGVVAVAAWGMAVARNEIAESDRSILLANLAKRESTRQPTYCSARGIIQLHSDAISLTRVAGERHWSFGCPGEGGWRGSSVPLGF
jgi:hypothetical protein